MTNGEKYFLDFYFHSDDIIENLTEQAVVMYLQELRKLFKEIPPTHDSKVWIWCAVRKAYSSHCFAVMHAYKHIMLW